MSIENDGRVCCPRCGAKFKPQSPVEICPACALSEALIPLPPGGAKALSPDDFAGLADPKVIPPKTMLIVPSDSMLQSRQVQEKPGDHIGRYKLLQQIGEGGCGIVYMAEQEEPVKRRVALKVIKPGMDTKQVLARFEAERQALALMDHPNIAKVFDAGATENGRPYFVMELVRGIRITEYCDQHNLSTPKRLDLFTQACKAIQHAHQKGIIHRDIKPSNILVTSNDGGPVCMVIDFGIAKATTGQQLTDKTLFTAFEQFIGTPAYMSPEQAEMSSLDIDTRSDIYSLGVLLYELLTGKTPFDAQTLLKAGLDEMRRIIREDDPARPSTRLSTLRDQEQITVAKCRGLELPKLINLVRADLDWVVMKCLEKDRTRRYGTANGLVADIQHYLNNEPVEARPPSQIYRFRKLAGRNKFAFAMAGTILTLLLAGITASTWQAIRANRAESQKAQLLGKALTAQADAAREKDQALRRLYDSLVNSARATRMARQTGYRTQVFELLRQAQALNVPQKDLQELRCEAVACLGDFVGLTPTTLSNLPTGISIGQQRVDPNGQRAAFLLGDGSILLSELPSGKEICRLANEDPAVSFSFNEKGDSLTSVHLPRNGSDSKRQASASVRKWTADWNGVWKQTGNVTLPGAFACCYTETGPMVAVRNSSPHSVELYNSDRALVARHEAQMPNAGGSWFALSHDGQVLALASQSRSAFLESEDLRTGQSDSRVESVMPEICDFALSSDGNYAAWISVAGCSVYSTKGFERVAALGGYFFPAARFTFCSGSSVLALPLTQQHCVRLWDALRCEEYGVVRVPGAPWHVSSSADGGVILASGGNQAWSFQLRTPDELLRLSGHSGGTPGAAFSPDGAKIASVGKDRLIKVWDSANGRLVWKGDLPDQGQCVAFSPDGRLVAAGCWGTHRLRIWDVKTGERVLELGADEGGITWTLLFSADSKKLMAAADDSGTLQGFSIWPLDPGPTGNRMALTNRSPVKCFPHEAYGLTSALEGRQFAFFGSGGSGAIYLSELDDAEGVPVFHAIARGESQGMSLTPDGHRLLIINKGRKVVTIDRATGAELFSFSAVRSGQTDSGGEQYQVRPSPDGAYLAVPSPSNLGVDIWKPDTGELVCALPESSGEIWLLAWSPDSQRLAIARSNGDLSVWNLKGVMASLSQLNLSPQLNQKPYSVPDRILSGWRGLDLADAGRWEESLTPLTIALNAAQERNAKRRDIAPLLFARTKALRALGRNEATNGISSRPRDGNLLVNGDFNAPPILGTGQSDLGVDETKIIATSQAVAAYSNSISGIRGWTYNEPNDGGTSSDHGLARLTAFGDASGPCSAFINNWGRMLSQTTIPAAVGCKATAKIEFGTTGSDDDQGRAGTFYLVAGEADLGNEDGFSARSIILDKVVVGNPTFTNAPLNLTVTNQVWVALALTHSFTNGDPALNLPLTVAFRTENFSVGPTFWSEAKLFVKPQPTKPLNQQPARDPNAP